MKNVLLLALGMIACSNVSAQRPNIIYIMTDDMGYGDLGSYGCKDYATPNLDKLASQGMRFVNCYSAAPLCTPTRAALMTGRYPARTPVGLIEPLTGSPGDTTYGLTPDYPSMATLMKNAGYETALIGKWHLGAMLRHSPVRNGFDYFYGFRDGAADYISHTNVGGKHDLYENDTPISQEGYLTEMFSEKVVQYLEQDHSKPFLLVVNYNAPHWPWQGPRDKAYPDSTNFRNGGSAEIYAEMMQSLDSSVGNIMKALDDAQLANQTIVIFTNDNGGERYSRSSGLSRGKATLWEGGIRVPAFVRWPGKIKPNTVTRQVAITMDWTATILAAGGATVQKDYPGDGIDLMPILTAKTPDIERTLYWRTFQRSKEKAIRMGNWKYLKDAEAEYLFDLDVDESEKNDLKEKHPDVFVAIKKKYADWEKSMLKPKPL